MPRTYIEGRIEKIKALVEEGKTRREIAKILNLTVSALEDYSKKHQIKLNKKTDGRKEEILKLVSEGKTQAQIAKRLSLSRSSLSSFCKKYNIKIERSNRSNLLNHKLEVMSKKPLYLFKHTKPKYEFGDTCKYHDIESYIIGIAYRGTGREGDHWYYLLEWDVDQWIKESELTLLE